MIESILKKFHDLPEFTQAAVLVISAIFMFGIFGPSMISAKSTFAVWIGIGALVAYSYFAYLAGKPLIDKLTGR